LAGGGKGHIKLPQHKHRQLFGCDRQKRQKIRLGAKGGEEGLEKASSIKPDLILLDVIMPKINGIQVLQKLKDSPDTKNIPVVILTVIGEQDIIDKALKLGAEGYIIKSTVDLNQLISEIKSYLKN